jgi:CheY-like chemotaxis protein
MNLIVIKGLLKNTGVKIDTALSGVEALGLINTIRYDVIFIDHRMPNMSGIELLHIMNESEENKNVGVPVIALTANVVSGARDMYLKEGFTDYMSKPVDGARLEDMIVRLVPEEKINLLKPLENVSNSEKEKPRESEASSSNITIGTSNYGGTAVKSQGAKLNAEERFNKDVEGIDFDMAVQNCGGEDVLEEVLENFLINIDSKHDMIEKYYKEGDIRNYTIQVHSIKSSARLIGAMDISRRAASLEQNGMDENVDEINKLTPKFLEDLLTYKDKINTVLRKDGASKVYKPEIEINMLKDAFRSLEELVAAFDFDGADSIMDMLDEYSVPAEYQEVYDKLIQLMAAVDIDGLTALLKKVNAEN